MCDCLPTAGHHCSLRPPCSDSYSGGGGGGSRLSGKGVAELAGLPANAYFEVPEGLLPEAAKEYYADPVLKARWRRRREGPPPPLAVLC